ncbi:MAG: VWA domain-containing protein [Thermaceae bacterium]|nr:VWA domain-containing protein [Thermaceae bacterium]
MWRVADQTPFPYGCLDQNLIAFCDHLRRVPLGFQLGPQEVQDGLLALEAVRLGNVQEARQALKLVLCKTPEQERGFDDLFFQFFLASRRRPSPTLPQASLPGEEGPAEDPAPLPKKPNHPPLEGAEGGAGLSQPRAEDPQARGLLGLKALFSPAGTGKDIIEVPQTDLEGMLAAARALLRTIRLGKSRRWHPAAQGRRVHFRRTLRKGLQTGGEFIHTAWLAHPHQEPRFVLVLDASRSMAAYTETLLQFAFALRLSSARVEVFSFSTHLKRLTRELEAHPNPDDPPRLSGMAEAWGGGTRIGESLRHLERHYSGLVGPHTVLLIASDGLDTGEPQVLESALRTLYRRSAALIWLNPLLALPGYNPQANCMKTALPYLDRFCSAHTPQELARLADGLQLRR